MEINKFKENLKLSRKERELNYWSGNYDQAFQNLDLPSIIDDQIILNNELRIKEFRRKYPFYNDLLLLVSRNKELSILKAKIVQLIISYLEIINEDGNILVEKGSLKSISKKIYSQEKTKILKDLESILNVALISNEIDQKKGSIAEDITKQIGLKPSPAYIKPGRKDVSKLAVIALKYHIKGMFDKTENPYSDISRFASVQNFYNSIAEEESINIGSFSNKYKEIGRERDLETYCKANPKVVQALIDTNCFTEKKECFEFLSQFGVDMI